MRDLCKVLVTASCTDTLLLILEGRPIKSSSMAQWNTSGERQTPKWSHWSFIKKQISWTRCKLGINGYSAHWSSKACRARRPNHLKKLNPWVLISSPFGATIHTPSRYNLEKKVLISSAACQDLNSIELLSILSRNSLQQSAIQRQKHNVVFPFDQAPAGKSVSPVYLTVSRVSLHICVFFQINEHEFP